MVEEATAASASLATEADRLRQLISQFQLGNAGHDSPRAPVTASAEHQPVASPARRMMKKVAGALGMGGGAKPADSWEEF
jgi:methyl-accepting chemotaxis protein